MDLGRHLILPVITLVVVSIAGDSRFVRAAMIDALNQDFVRTARAKGVAERSVVYRHALRNALLPVVTNIALELPFLFAGAIATETIFSWPGMGLAYIQAVNNYDYPVLMGILVITAFVVIFATCSPTSSTRSSTRGSAMADVIVPIDTPEHRHHRAGLRRPARVAQPMADRVAPLQASPDGDRRIHHVLRDGPDRDPRAADPAVRHLQGPDAGRPRRRGPAAEPRATSSGETGRLQWDVLTLVVNGIRFSLLIALIASAIAAILGTLVGGIAGYFGGWTDTFLMRIVDALLAIPLLFVILVFTKFLGSGSWVSVAIIFGLFGWLWHRPPRPGLFLQPPRGGLRRCRPGGRRP